MKFSANLGFLWNDLPLPHAIEKAAASGFDAVEFHWPYQTGAGDVAAALAEFDLPAIGINAPCGDLASGEFGIAALEGRETEARAGIDQALDYGAKIGCPKVHVLAGKSTNEPGAERIFAGNLEYACRRAEAVDATILIEPINTFDVPGYYLNRIDHALHIIKLVGAGNLKIMFDCYHVARLGDDIMHAFKRASSRIGHVQFAGVPDRGEPDQGQVDLGKNLLAISVMGWQGFFGAEYRPTNPSEPDFKWLEKFRNLSPQAGCE